MLIKTNTDVFLAKIVFPVAFAIIESAIYYISRVSLETYTETQVDESLEELPQSVGFVATYSHWM